MEYTVLVDDNDVILHAADGKKLLLNRETVARRLGMRQPHRPTIGSKNRNASRFCAAGNQRPRHSPRMTHFCSFRLTSTLRRGQVVLSRATLYPCPASGDFIHAERRAGCFPSSAPAACKALNLQEDICAPVKPINHPSVAGRVRTGTARRQERLLPGGKSATPSAWWWVTFGEQSRVISPECRRRF